jgi:hypothetical protein
MTEADLVMAQSGASYKHLVSGKPAASCMLKQHPQPNSGVHDSGLDSSRYELVGGRVTWQQFQGRFTLANSSSRSANWLSSHPRTRSDAWAHVGL